jgi:hypothetical protein
MIKKRTNKSCLDLTSTEAKQFFLKEESYFTLDLPPYFSFQKTLNEVDQQITNKLLSDFRDGSPRDLEDLIPIKRLNSVLNVREISERFYPRCITFYPA